MGIENDVAIRRFFTILADCWEGFLVILTGEVSVT
jgi:hypothetical protein